MKLEKDPLLGFHEITDIVGDAFMPGVRKKDTKAIIHTTMQVIVDGLKKGYRIRLPDLGEFYTSFRKGGIMYNKRGTSKYLKIPDYPTVKLRMYRSIRNEIRRARGYTGVVEEVDSK